MLFLCISNCNYWQNQGASSDVKRMDFAPKFALTARQSRLRCTSVPIPTHDVHVMKSAGSIFFALAFALAMPAPAQAARLDNAFRTGDHPRTVKSVGPAAERGDADRKSVV